MSISVLGLRTVIYPAPDLAAGATVHTPASEVGDDIVTATVVAPQGAIVGFILNPHFTGP